MHRSAWQIQRAVIFAIVRRELKARAGGQWVGAVWTLFEPLSHILVLTIWLTVVRGRGMAGIEYPVFLATGLIPFFFFQKLVTRLLDGVEANHGLLAYRQVTPMDLLVGRAAVECLMNLAVYALTLAALAWLGYHVLPTNLLQVLVTNTVIAGFGLSFGTLTATLCHRRPRLRSIVRMTFWPLYISSGVIFRIELLPSQYYEWLLWNPLLHLVELSRAGFIGNYQLTPGINLQYPLKWLLVVMALGLGMYQLNRQRLLTR